MKYKNLGYSYGDTELLKFKTEINLLDYLIYEQGWQIDEQDSDKKQSGFTALRKEPDQKLLVKKGVYYEHHQFFIV